MQTPNDNTFFVSAEEAGVRLDSLLKNRFPDYSRSYFQSLILQKLVLVNGKIAKKRALLKKGDEIEVEFAITKEISIKAEPIDLNILFEDQYMIAINKPAGMVVHPAYGNWTKTFVNALIYHCKNLERDDSIRPGIVHRLDKDTSGVLLAAKTQMMQTKLVSLFATRKIEKQYLAICIGNPGNQTIESQIARHPKRRKEMTVVEKGGKDAITICKTIAFDDKLSVVKLFPKTGRTHQLRVHLKSIGCPILGDSVYGKPSINKKLKVERQLLHAQKVSFCHPITKVEMIIEAPVPQDIERFIQKLKS